MLSSSIEELVEDNDAYLSKIWIKFSKNIKEIIINSFQKIYNNAKKGNIYILFNFLLETSEISKKIVKNKYLEALETNVHIDINASNSSEEDILNAQVNYKQKLAYKAGWTVNIAGNNEFSQLSIECLTWSQSTGTTFRVWLGWAEVCHKGHKLKQNKEHSKRFICSWGISQKYNDRDEIIFYWKLLKDEYKDMWYKRKEFETGDRQSQSKSYINDDSNKSDRLRFESDEISNSIDLDNKDDNFISSNNMKNDEMFEKELLNYTTSEFIKDLIYALEMSELGNNSSNYLEDDIDYFRYDESMKRYIHLYEYIILLAQGIWRPGLIEILTKSENSNDKFTRKVFVWLSSIIQGDFENYLQNWKELFTKLKVKEGSGSKITQKAVKLMMLVHSSTHYTEANEISGVKDEYQKLFKDLFPQHYKSIMLLHKLVSLGSAKISKIFLSKSKETQTEEDKENILMYDTHIEELLVRNLCLDKNNFEWISALTRTSAKEISGLDYICEWYDVSKTKRNVYKAILTKDEIYIKQLFESISNGINYEITDSIWNILKGDFNAVGDIIIKQINSYAKDNKDFIITNDEKEKGKLFYNITK